MSSIVSKIYDEINLHGSWDAYLQWCKINNNTNDCLGNAEKLPTTEKKAAKITNPTD